MAMASDIIPLPRDLLGEYSIPYLTENECHAFLSYHENDRNTACFIKDELVEAGFTVLSQDDIQPGQLVLDQLDQMLHRCKKVIFLVTEASLNDRQFFFEAITAQMKSSKEQGKVTIMVLHQIEAAKVPAYILEVTYIPSSDRLFWRRLLNAMTKHILMSALIDTTGIAEGLAWSYYVKYLQLVMQPLAEGMLERDRDSDKCCLPLFVVLMPNSGHSRDLNEIDPCIMFEDKLVIRKDVAGAKGRDYSICIVKLKDPHSDKEYCIAVEYATPLQTMSDMVCGQIAGLSEEQQVKETNDFSAILSDIIKSHPCQCDVYPLVYDDKDEHIVSQQVLKHINERFPTHH